MEKSETRSPGWTIVRDVRNKDIGVIGGRSSLVSHDTRTWGCVLAHVIERLAPPSLSPWRASRVYCGSCVAKVSTE